MSIYDPTTGAVILAAGGSTRFGGAKAAAPWGDTTLLQHTLTLAHTICDTVLTVTGGNAETLSDALHGTNHIHNPQWQEGMGTSIALGFAALTQQHPQLQRILLLTIDQPLTTVAHLQALLAACAGDKVILTSNGQHRGPPACVPRAVFPKAMTLTGDRGLKAVLAPDQIATVENAAALQDTDTPEALANLLARSNGEAHS